MRAPVEICHLTQLRGSHVEVESTPRGARNRVRTEAAEQIGDGFRITGGPKKDCTLAAENEGKKSSTSMRSTTRLPT